MLLKVALCIYSSTYVFLFSTYLLLTLDIPKVEPEEIVKAQTMFEKLELIPRAFKPGCSIDFPWYLAV